MPSDDTLIRGAVEAVREPAEAFHSALARAIEDVRSFLARHRASAGDPKDLAAAELGRFGEGRVDATRFAALIAPPKTIGSADLLYVERALEILVKAESRGTDLWKVRVHGGGNLRETVATALADTGRVFGVMRRIAPLLDGRGTKVDAGNLGQGYPFESWTRAERAAAPPLVVEVEGSDMNGAAGLSEFLDGAQKIVLVVRGTAPPAPLAHLISPRVFVMQTQDPAELLRLGKSADPAIAAIAAVGLVPFLHDPSLGRRYADRLTVGDIPAPDELRTLGFRQIEEVEHLRELADTHRGAPRGDQKVESTPVAPPEADPVDHLAGWLLQQANLVDGAEHG